MEGEGAGRMVERKTLSASELRFEAQSSGLAAEIVTELINLSRSLFPYL